MADPEQPEVRAELEREAAQKREKNPEQDRDQEDREGDHADQKTQ